MDDDHSINTYFEPIKKKWVYNFLISPKTRNIEKPEWYLNQTLKWIYDHIDSVEEKVRTRTEDENLKHKFLHLILELVMIRLNEDMSRISDFSIDQTKNENILIHTYNEVVQFLTVIRKLLGDSYHDLDEKCDLMSVFATKDLYEKIIEVEWDYAEKNLKEITRSPVRWDPVLESEFVDIYKVPRCVDYLLMLLRSITERVECFRQNDCQFTLIELQCSLLNKFLLFLRKSTESQPGGMNILSDMLLLSDQSTIDLTRLSKILNGLNFLRLILKERSFIPARLLDTAFDPALLKKVDKLTQDYRKFFDQLVGEVVSIYEGLNCDLDDFLNFIRPKLSQHIFQMISDEATRIFHERKTKTLLEGLDLSQD